VSSSSTSAIESKAPRTVQRAALITHGRPEAVGEALARVEALAAGRGIELVGEEADADLAVALGGDGTMLRALHRYLGTGVPVIGVNFGRIGFLTSIASDELEAGLARAFSGELKVIELATLALTVNGQTHAAINDVVATSATPGRMIELGSTVGGEPLGDQACDGMICCTPSGSTAYNLSSGGPVIMWGLDAMAITFVAPHSLHARPLVVPPGLGLAVTNQTPDVPVTVVVDGHRVGEIAPGESFAVDVGAEKGRLALLPEVTFFTRLRDVFL
jgi:NAD+ kinase